MGIKQEIQKIFKKLKELGYDTDSQIAKAINCETVTVGTWRRLEKEPKGANFRKLKNLAIEGKPFDQSAVSYYGKGQQITLPDLQNEFKKFEGKMELWMSNIDKKFAVLEEKMDKKNLQSSSYKRATTIK
jgi:hypothetical protein